MFHAWRLFVLRGSACRSPNHESVFGRLSAERHAYAVHLAQTFDHLSVSWVAGDSNLFPGSGIDSRRRQLDHTRFPRSYLLDLRHVARHPRHPEFNWRGVVSQVGSIAHSFLVDGPFRDSARHRLRRLWKAAARRLSPVDKRSLMEESPRSNRRDSLAANWLDKLVGFFAQH